MYSVAQKIRIAAVIVGCCVIIAGLISNCPRLVYSLAHVRDMGQYAASVLSDSISSLMSAFYSGTLVILAALIMNPDKFSRPPEEQEPAGVKAGKAAETLRSAAVIVGCCVIIAGVIFRCINIVTSVDLFAYQHGAFYRAATFVYGVAASFSSGMLIILAALMIKPGTDAPLKVFSSLKRSVSEFLASFREERYAAEDYGEEAEDDEVDGADDGER